MSVEIARDVRQGAEAAKCVFSSGLEVRMIGLDVGSHQMLNSVGEVVFVEVPSGSRNKYELDEELGGRSTRTSRSGRVRQ